MKKLIKIIISKLKYIIPAVIVGAAFVGVFFGFHLFGWILLPVTAIAYIIRHIRKSRAVFFTGCRDYKSEICTPSTCRGCATYERNKNK